MTQPRLPDDLDPASPPGTDGLDARLGAWLRAAAPAGDAGARGEVGLPDPARVAAHFAGPGDEGLLDAASRTPEVRRLLVEIGDVLETPETALETALETTPQTRDLAADPRGDLGPSPAAASDAHAANGSVGRNGHVSPNGRAGRHGHAKVSGLSPSVRAGALAAFDASLAGTLEPETEAAVGGAAESVGGAVAPLRVLRGGGRATLARAAAVLVLVGGAALALSTFAGRSVEAGPALALEAVERLDGSGAIAAEGPRRAALGQRFTAGDARRLSLRLAGGARVVLGAGDEIRVACDGDSCGRAAFALERGEALVSAGEGTPAESRTAGVRGFTDGVRLLLPGGGVLDVRRGAAHVATTAAGETAIALRADAEAVLAPPASGGGAPTAATLVGPAAIVVSAAGVRATGPAAAALFRDLEFFGGRLRRGTPDRHVSAPLWRIARERAPSPRSPAESAVAGPRGALARMSDAEGLPAIRLDLEPGESARLAWRPDASALAADRIDVRVEIPAPRPPASVPVRGPGAVRAAGEAPSPAVRDAGRLEVAVESPAAAFPGPGAAVPGPAARGTVPPPGAVGAGRLVLPLPPGWGAAVDGGEIEIVFTARDAPVRAWFTGAAFRVPTAAPPPAPGRDLR